MTSVFSFIWDFKRIGILFKRNKGDFVVVKLIIEDTFAKYLVDIFYILCKIFSRIFFIQKYTYCCTVVKDLLVSTHNTNKYLLIFIQTLNYGEYSRDLSFFFFLFSFILVNGRNKSHVLNKTFLSQLHAVLYNIVIYLVSIPNRMYAENFFISCCFLPIDYNFPLIIIYTE